MTIIILLINIIINPAISYSGSRNKVDNYYLKSNLSTVYPNYNYNNKNYYINNCDNKVVKIFLYNKYNKIIKTFIIKTKLDSKSKLLINDRLVYINCIDSNLNKLLYKFDNYSGVKSLNLVSQSEHIILYDNYGEILHKKYFPGYKANYAEIDQDGNITALLLNHYDILKSGFSAPISANSNSAKVIEYNLANSSKIKSITPYEIINNKVKYLPIDYHGFEKSESGYYFISYEDKIINKLPEGYYGNKAISREVSLCKNENEILLRVPRIVKTTLSGKLIWSYIVDEKDHFHFGLIYNKNNKIPCMIDKNHPNYISVDPKEESLTIGLNYYGIINISFNNDDLINFKITYNFEGMDKSQDKKVLDIKGDPLVAPCRTHSGTLIENKLIFFDNRCLGNEFSRGVIYQIDKESNKAIFKKMINIDDKERYCSVSININCLTINMGNIHISEEGFIVINWGNMAKGGAISSIYDKKFKKVLDISAPDNSRYGESEKVYISKFYTEKYFKDIKAIYKATS
jgi:hypothetical protein